MIATLPSQPLLLYDGTCAFCLACARWAQGFTRRRVAFQSYQKAGNAFPGLNPGELGRYVHLVDTDGTVFLGAAAACRALSYRRGFGLFLWCYRHLPLFGAVAEFFYEVVSHNRHRLSVFFKKDTT